jgi:protein-S-isoprenylcysteine O-methyltransferase Ste14
MPFRGARGFMFEPGEIRALAGAVFAGTAVGVALLLRIALRGRAHRAPSVAKWRQAKGAEPAWAVGSMAAQVWALGVLLLPAFFSGWPALPTFPGDTVLEILGLGMWIAGLILVDVSAWVLGRFLVSSAEVQRDHRLVREGPYRWIRHPMYTANVAMALGLALTFLSLPLLVLAAGLAALASYRARLEEDLLRSPQGFGREYESYAGQTGRFLPRVRWA